MILTIITWIAFLTFAIQLGFWIFIFSKIGFLSPIQPILTHFKGVSVIICVKNEAENISRLIQLILDQNYPEFELIIIDDHSQDQTWEIISNYANKDPKIRVFKNPKAGKKPGIIYGVGQAMHSWLLFTDGDCTPSSKLWIQSMIEHTSESKIIVLGYAPYFKANGWLNKLIRFEGVFNTIQSFSGVLIGIPYMGVGRNLMYHKSISDPLKMRLELAFGDDDLLVNRQATSENTTIATHVNSFVYSHAKKTWSSYFNQKRRHFSSSLYYNLRSKILISSFFMSLFVFYFTLTILFLNGYYGLTFSLYFIKIIISWTLYSKCCNKWNEKDLIPLYPILELQYVLFLLVQIPFLFIPKKTW